MIVAVLIAFAATTPTEDLRTAFDSLECERVIELASKIDATPDVKDDEKREARFRRGYCLVVIGNVGEAGALFQQIFEEDLDAAAPFPMEQRILYLVDVARSEVKARRAREAEERRRQLVERITLHATPPDELKGGARAFFDVKLDDPDDVVHSLRVDFRKRGEPEFYALPVKRQTDGTWRGEVPGTYTKSAQGTTLEWFVTASDDKGERLTSFGSRETPKILTVLPGSVVAEDLRANERMGYGTRIAAGIVVTPAMTALAMIVGGYVGTAGLIIDDAFFPRDLLDVGADAPIGYFGVLLVSAAAGITSGTLVTFTLLDGTAALWSAGAIAVPIAIGVVYGVAQYMFAAPEVVLEINAAGTIALVAGSVAIVAGAIVTPLFVLNDPPQE